MEHKVRMIIPMIPPQKADLKGRSCSAHMLNRNNSPTQYRINPAKIQKLPIEKKLSGQFPATVLIFPSVIIKRKMKNVRESHATEEWLPGLQNCMNCFSTYFFAFSNINFFKNQTYNPSFGCLITHQLGSKGSDNLRGEEKGELAQNNIKALKTNTSNYSYLISA